MSAAWPLVIAAACLHGAVTATEVSHRSRQNPIRKVVNMLKIMETKVTEEGHQKKELFTKYMCYCDNTAAELKNAISVAEDKVPQLQSGLAENTATHKQLVNDVAQHKTERADAKSAMDNAEALRQQGKEAFMRDSANMQANINALQHGIASLEKGMGGFLQTSAASMLKKLSLSLDMSGADREVLTTFLSQGQGSGEASEYAPQSGEILGILKQMLSEMEQELVDMKSEEEKARANHESLKVAKTKEVAVASKAIEEKTGRAGELAVAIATMSDDLEDIQKGLQADRTFLTDIQRSCSTKKAEWAEYEKSRADELVCLAETIKMLNDDDALEMFKNTLPSPSAASFLQVEDTQTSARKQARAILRKVRHRDHRLNFLELALRGRKKGFDQVMQKIDALISGLKREQQDDDEKKQFCEREIDATEENLKEKDRHIKDVNTFISEAQESLGETKEAINALLKGIQALDEQVKDATVSRKQEHSEALGELAANNAAKGLLELAKNRLQKLYNPSLYKPPAKQELSSQDRITNNFYGASAASFVQVRSLRGSAESDAEAEEDEGEDEDESEADAQAPEADFRYQKKGEESGGVMAMLDELRADLQKQNTEVEMEEKASQASYEELMKRSAEKRALDSKAIADKESTKAELEAKIHSHKEDLSTQQQYRDVSDQELHTLHRDCDWLLQYHSARKEARVDETDSLQKAKAVLAGANYGR